ncbi:AAA family ATPase [Campylobacter sp.]|uniref:McrB family protein n=1 Tax=Campylobacter sp. TaxID=205 RepID=UPI0025C254C3|nr:AAA family ATPase [Campylobacter sp.]
MIEFLNEDREKFKECLINFFRNAYNGDKLLRKDEEDNFIFLKKYDFFAKLSYGRGKVAKIPWIIFIRMDTQEYKASYGVYVYCGIKRESGEIFVRIGDSEDVIINYIAKNKVYEYNRKFNNVAFNYPNLNNDIEAIIDKIIENMQWFKNLPINEIQDRNYLSKINNKEIRNDENEKIYKEQYFENEKAPSENQNLPLNQILYGPPGTGKTYHTIDKALEILGENLQTRDEKKAKFNEYVKNGQIIFTTFHQSYGYEEFIEGIKPDFDDENSEQIKYKIQDGVFKKLCNKALENKDSMENFKKYIEKLKEDVRQNENNPEEYFKLLNTKYLIQYKDGKTFRIKFNDMSKNHKDYPVSIDNIEKLYKTSNVDEIHNIAYVKAVLNYLKSQGLKDYQEKDEKVNLPYIIIIDEINRGNVSKIFGELISLIEPSKRIGAKEELKITLPYSGEKFGVPKNVYIIGTMNTADKSITSLDTALRRRFEFIEMMPKCDDLDIDCEGVNLQELLRAINTRIEYLLDREKTIGHAFFIGVKNLKDLKFVFQNKIIPLLQEYFYDDYALIDAVLNKNGMLEKQDINNNYLKNMREFIESDKVIYKFSDSKFWDKTTFKKIYE